MERKLRFAALVAVLCIVVPATNASSQVGNIGAFFCDGQTLQAAAVCQGVGVLDTLCVVAWSPTCQVYGVEFAIDYPPAVTVVSETFATPTAFGTTSTGVSMLFPTLQGPGSVTLAEVVVMWNCDHCQGYFGQAITVIPHPGTNFLGLTSCGFLTVLEPLQGLQTTICAIVPVEETNWGRVKALYQ